MEETPAPDRSQCVGNRRHLIPAASATSLFSTLVSSGPGPSDLALGGPRTRVGLISPGWKRSVSEGLSRICRLGERFRVTEGPLWLAGSDGEVGKCWSYKKQEGVLE